MSIGLGPHGGGKLRWARPGVYLHWCKGCGTGHTFDVHQLIDGHVLGFDGDLIRPTLGHPLRHEVDGKVCEYFLQAGVLHYYQNCWHELVGKSVLLPEFPI